MLGLGTVTNLLRQIQKHRWQIGVITWRDFTSPYRKTRIGALWAFILPVIPVSAYILLRVVIRSTEMHEGVIHPAAYVAYGVTVWFLLADMILVPIVSLQKYTQLIAQTRFPVAGAILAGAGRVLLELCIRLVFLIPVLYFFADLNLAFALYGVLLIFIGMFAFLAIGILSVPLWIISADIHQIIDISLRYLIFFSLVIFPITTDKWIKYLIIFNPFARIIEDSRNYIIGFSENVDFIFLAGLTGVTLLLLYGALYTIGRLQNYIREGLQ